MYEERLLNRRDTFYIARRHEGAVNERRLGDVPERHSGARDKRKRKSEFAKH